MENVHSKGDEFEMNHMSPNKVDHRFCDICHRVLFGNQECLFHSTPVQLSRWERVKRWLTKWNCGI